MKAETFQMHKYNSLIQGRLISIQSSAKETLKNLRDGNESLPDFYDQASLETDRNLDLLLRELDRRSAHEMKEAMRRMKEGTFGICKACKKSISARRLQVNPMATLCVDCKEREERNRRRAQQSGGWSLYDMESSEA